MCLLPPGADLANLMNEAAILAARRNLKEISKVGFLGLWIGAGLCEPVSVASVAGSSVCCQQQVAQPQGGLQGMGC